MCMNQPMIAEALGSSQMSFHLGLIGFSFLYSPIGLITGILSNAYSRKNPFFAYLTYERGNRVAKQVSLFPIIPSISYRIQF